MKAGSKSSASSFWLSEVKIDARAASVLLILAEGGGAVVEDNVFFERLWPGNEVNRPGALMKQVSNLRAAIGDRKKKIIERDPEARGYRLACEAGQMIRIGDHWFDMSTKRIWKIQTADGVRRLNLAIVALVALVMATILALAVTLGFFVPKARLANLTAGLALTLSCPPEIRSHEALIFGSIRLGAIEADPRSDAAVVVYVHPEVAYGNYYRQDWSRMGDGVWWMTARFGNEEEIDMVAQLPFHFRAFAVYVSPASLARELDASWQDPLVEAESDQALIRRLRDRVQGRGTFLASNSCRVYRISSQDCSGRIPIVLSPAGSGNNASPVVIRWLGDQPMYLELRKGTTSAELFGSRSTPAVNGTELDLEAGRYQLKVSAERSFTCPAIVWFKVGADGFRRLGDPLRSLRREGED